MELPVVIAALAGGTAAALLVPRAGPRGAHGIGVRGGPAGRPVGVADATSTAAAGSASGGAGPPSRLVWVAGGVAGLGASLLIGGPVGVGVGLALALLLPVGLQRLEPAAVRRRRLAMLRAAPLVADLLAASLAAGVPVERALPVIARAVGGPTEAALLLVEARMRLGEPAAAAWLHLREAPGLAVIARCVARSSRTGAPLATLLAITAEELRDEAAAASLAEVRAVSVRSVLPLGLCLLPAFVLLGIVPVVAGMLPAL